MVKVVLINPNITNSELEFTEDVDFLAVEQDAIMAIAQLVGWVDATKSTKLVRVDADGNLLVSTEGTAGDELASSVASVTTSAVEIVSSRANRKTLMLTNEGANDVYIASVDTVLVANGFTIPSGATLTLDNYIGSIYGISATGTNSIRVMEVI